MADFKYGKGVEVEAEENDQLSYYALGALDYVGFGFPDIEEVVLAISQPRLRREVSEWTTTVTALREVGRARPRQGRREPRPEAPEVRGGRPLQRGLLRAKEHLPGACRALPGHR